MDEKNKKILKNIENGYDLMADKFSSTRNFFWRDLAFIGDYAEKGDRVLDFGCGNGRLLEILEDKQIKYWGVDVSIKLIQLAREKYPQFKSSFSKIEGEQSLSLEKNFFNLIFSIAVFHHFSPSYQKEKIKELYNLLKPGGKIILTVWDLQKKYQEKEVNIPFQDNSGKIFKRYHYVFSEQDLTELLKEAGFEIEKCDTINKKNILIIAKK